MFFIMNLLTEARQPSRASSDGPLKSIIPFHPLKIKPFHMHLAHKHIA